MTWQRRLLEMLAAGGAMVSLTGCPPFGATCNANPDPCCAHPDLDTPQCNAEAECRAEGGTWEFFSGRVVIDAGDGSGSGVDSGSGSGSGSGSATGSGSGSGLEGHCVFPCPGPAYNCGMDAAMTPTPDASTVLPDAKLPGD